MPRKLLFGAMLATCLGCKDSAPTLSAYPSGVSGIYALDSVNLQPLPQTLFGTTMYAGHMELREDHTFSSWGDRSVNGVRDTTYATGTWMMEYADFRGGVFLRFVYPNSGTSDGFLHGGVLDIAYLRYHLLHR